MKLLERSSFIKNKITIFILCVYILTGFIVFQRLPFTFFQQDEWVLFGNFIYWDKAGLSWFERLFTYEHYGHLIPLSDFFSYWRFNLFKLHFLGYGIFSISIHIINAYLVYIFARSLLKNNMIAFISALLFLTSSTTHQTITWTVTTMGTAGSTFFVILSLIFFIKYVKEKERLRFLLLSLVLFLVALGFKETPIFLFFFMPAFFLIWKDYKVSLRKLLFSSGTMLFLYIIFRITFFLLNPIPEQKAQDLVQPPTPAYVFRVFVLPIRLIVQSIVPAETIIKTSRSLIRLAYPQFMRGGNADPYIVESVGADIITLVFFIIIMIAGGSLILFFEKRKQKRLSKTILISFVFVALSSTPFIVVPGRAGFTSLLDGRHLYLSYIFVSILLAVFIYGIYVFSSWKKTGGIIAVILISIFILFNVKNIRRDIHMQVAIGNSRYMILSKVTDSYPKLPGRVLFYFESDKAYYGLPEEEKILPFQSGLGQTLLVWYNAAGESFPACFYKGEEYLYELLSEGYKECEGRGFGYFRKKESLIIAAKKNNLPPENIIGFSYASSSNSLRDITEKLRKDLEAK